MAKPLVSVLISVYNAGEYLRPSVKSIIEQTYSNLEIIIIDDGSTDNCMDSIADFKDSRISVINQENAGKAIALNRAMDKLKGEFYIIQDADDISYPHRIERLVECMLEHPELAAVFTGYDLILNGYRIAPRIAAKSIEQCHRDIEEMQMPAHDPTSMFRMSMVRDIRYAPDLRVGQGIDYIFRVGECHPMMVLGECLYSYRVHLDSTTRYDVIRRKRMVQEVYRRAFERRGLQYAKNLDYERKLTGRLLCREQESGIIPHFMESVLDLRLSGQFSQAMNTAFACLRLHPFDPYYYKPLIYLVVPMAVIQCYRSRRKGK
jgi:glycosyltransferase involved in cell wall biosynthesis